MKTIFLAGLFVGAMGPSLGLFLPLEAALHWTRASEAGLTLDRASGSIWNGTLHGARIGGFPLGDVEAHMDPLSLLSGSYRLTLSGEKGRATLVAGRERGLEDADVVLGAERLGLAFPLTGAVALKGDVLFTEGACKRADARVRADVLERTFGGPVLEGSLSCEGARAHSRLAATDGSGVGADLFVSADGSVEITTHVSGDSELASAAALAGFTRDEKGLQRKDQGRLGVQAAAL